MSIKDRAIKLIPEGMYCYERLESIKETSNFKVINPCPFHKYNDFLGLFYCEYLDEFGFPNHHTWENHKEDLIFYFGSEEEFYKKVGLDLLFDSVKECGENLGDDY